MNYPRYGTRQPTTRQERRDDNATTDCVERDVTVVRTEG